MSRGGNPLIISKMSNSHRVKNAFSNPLPPPPTDWNFCSGEAPKKKSKKIEFSERVDDFLLNIRGMCVSVIIALAVTGLICIILAGNVVTPWRFAIGEPRDYLAEFSEVFSSKHVFVSDHAPSAKRFLASLLNSGDFFPRNKIVNHRAQAEVPARTHYASISSSLLWQWEGEVFWDRYGQYGCRSLGAHLTRWRTSGINYRWFDSKFEVADIFPPFLVDSTSNFDGEIGAQGSMVSEIDNADNILHCLGRSCRLSNMALHCFGLFSGSLDRLSQFLSLIRIHQELEKADYDKSSTKPDDMPIVRRLIIAILGILVGFLLCLGGWECFDHQRRSLGTALVGSGGLLVASGLLLYWLTAFTCTWRWWL